MTDGPSGTGASSSSSPNDPSRSRGCRAQTRTPTAEGPQMRRLIYSMGVSLDGFIAGPGGEIDWSAPDEELHRFHNKQTAELGVHLCGRRLYEEMVYWETADRDPSASEH